MNLGDLYSQFSQFWSEILPVLIFHLAFLITICAFFGFSGLNFFLKWLFKPLIYKSKTDMIVKLGLTKMMPLILAILILSYSVVFKKLSGYATKYVDGIIVKATNNETKLWRYQEDKSDLAIIDFFRTHELRTPSKDSAPPYYVNITTSNSKDELALGKINDRFERILKFRERKLYDYRFSYPELYRAKVSWALTKENLSGYSFGLASIFPLFIIICIALLHFVLKIKIKLYRMEIFHVLLIPLIFLGDYGISELRKYYEKNIIDCITHKNRFVANQLMKENNIMSTDHNLIKNVHSMILNSIENHYTEENNEEKLFWFDEFFYKATQKKD